MFFPRAATKPSLQVFQALQLILAGLLGPPQIGQHWPARTFPQGSGFEPTAPLLWAQRHQCQQSTSPSSDVGISAPQCTSSKLPESNLPPSLWAAVTFAILEWALFFAYSVTSLMTVYLVSNAFTLRTLCTHSGMALSPAWTLCLYPPMCSFSQITGLMGISFGRREIGT